VSHTASQLSAIILNCVAHRKNEQCSIAVCVCVLLSAHPRGGRPTTTQIPLPSQPIHHPPYSCHSDAGGLACWCYERVSCHTMFAHNSTSQYDARLAFAQDYSAIRYLELYVCIQCVCLTVGHLLIAFVQVIIMAATDIDGDTP
jgi:hypothetical protein